MPGRSQIIKEMIQASRDSRLIKEDRARQALDMSREARMRRAADQGFDTGQRIYHGTSKVFDQFDVDASSKAAAFGPGVYVSFDPIDAARWAKTTDNSSVIPMYGRIDDVLRMEPLSEDAAAKLTAYLGRKVNAGDVPPYGSLERKGGTVSEGARAAGFAGVEHAGPGGKRHIVFSDPSAVRSVHAAFDPLKVDSRNLLAGIGGAAITTGIGAAGMLSPKNAQASEAKRKRTAREIDALRRMSAETEKKSAEELYRLGAVPHQYIPEEYPAIGAAADAVRGVKIGGTEMFPGVAGYLDYLAQRGRDPRTSELLRRAGMAALDVLP